MSSIQVTFAYASPSNALDYFVPKQYAERLARQLMDDADVDPLIVEVPNHGFHKEVAAALEEMGYRVELDEFRPRLTIYQKK